MSDLVFDLSDVSKEELEQALKQAFDKSIETDKEIAKLKSQDKGLVQDKIREKISNQYKLENKIILLNVIRKLGWDRDTFKGWLKTKAEFLARQPSPIDYLKTHPQDFIYAPKLAKTTFRPDIQEGEKNRNSGIS